MKPIYINHDNPIRIPQFTKLEAANKAIKELYCAIYMADSSLMGMQAEKDLFKSKPFYGGIVSTIRENLAKVHHWLNFIAPIKM